MSKIYKRIGKKFGKLIILEKLGNTKNGAAIVKCLCDCGTIKTVLSTNLHKNGTISCGCYHKEVIASKQPWKTELNKYIHTTVKRRNLSFNLTVEQFQNLCQQSCFYCGQPPSTKMHVSKEFKNGIDRIDSTKGYELDNVVPCCRICNDMKGSLSKENFLTRVQKIFAHMKL